MAQPASVIQQPRLVNRRGIYGLTISKSSAAPVARHWGTYIDSTIGCGT